MSLLSALEQYSQKDEARIEQENKKKAELLAEELKGIKGTEISVVKDEAGREIYRTEMKLTDTKLSSDELIKELEGGNPAIYTRNYYKNQGKIHFDMRSVDEMEIGNIFKRIEEILDL